jgi:C4-type Zn-finger protein
MEAFLAIGVFACIIALVVWMPRWTPPYCPICLAPLEATGEVNVISDWWGWQVIARRFVCTECMYRRTRVEFTRRPQGIKV